MKELWRPFFDLYWTQRAVAPFSHNPQKVFEAGFVAGMLKGAAVAEKELQIIGSVTEPDLSAGAVTLQTEYGVQYPPEPDDPAPVWVAEDIHEARGKAMAHHGKLISRTVGKWREVVE
jgi:hypothetical protein